MRAAAAVLAFLAIAIAGLGKRMDIALRIKVLDGVLEDIAIIREGITYHCDPLPEILKRTKGRLFSSCQSEMKNGFFEAWKKCVDSCSMLNEEEHSALMMLSTLGTSCAEEQRKMLDDTCKRIQAVRSKTEIELKEKGKMMISCSLLAGVLAAIIII